MWFMKFLNKTIEYGLYLLVFLLPIQTRWIIKAGELNGGYSEYATYSLYATDVLLILLLLLFVVREIASLTLAMTNKGLPRHNNRAVWWFIGGLLLISVISVFFAVNKPLALYKLGWLILGAGLFWLVISANYNRLKLIYFMLAGVFLQAALGIWQFLTQSSFASKWLGLALHNGADLGTSVIEAVGADGVLERWLRAYGGTDHPNILGGIIAIGVLLLAGEIIKFNEIPNSNAQLPMKFQTPMPNFKTNSNAKILKIINWVFLIIFTAALFFSFSRAAWLGLAIGLAIMAISAAVHRNLKLQRGLAEIILVMGIVLFILFSQCQNLITSRLGGEGRLEKKSTSERLVSYQESWQMIKNNLAFGVGLGNYTLALNRQAPNRQSFYYQPAHNVFMLVWAETGIVGLLFFIAVIIYVLAGLPACAGMLRLPAQAGRRAPRNDGIILMALIVMMSFDHWYFSLHFGVLFFWLVLGLTVREKNNSGSRVKPGMTISAVDKSA